MADQNTQNLAEKIANLLQAEEQNSELSSLRISIEKLNKRLDSIEEKLFSPAPSSVPGVEPVISHPSLEKYNVIEAIVDEVFENAETEKTCTFEPNGKPCDHCSMCSSHGF